MRASLYWEAGDVGIAARERFDAAFLKRAGERCEQLLDRGVAQYPTDPEALFWRTYVRSLTSGEGDAVQLARRLTASGAADTPYFYLYALSGGTAFVAEASALRRRSLARPTARNRYVLSVIEGVHGPASESNGPVPAKPH
jgi:hypothetical protein